MGRTLIEAQITTRAARAKLDEGVHWRAIDPEVHVGYRRGRRGGRWLVRWRGGETYQQQTIGTADDALEGDGVHVFSFAQATLTARSIVSERRARVVAEAAGPIQTIRSVVLAYVHEREKRELSLAGEGGTLKRDCRSRLNRHVLSSAALADLALNELTSRHLTEWLAGLDPKLATATRRRLVNDLKAALNSAGRHFHAQLPALFERQVRHGLASTEPGSTKARDLQVLTDNQVRAIISASAAVDHENGWEGALATILLLLAATGARFSQIARLRSGDVQVTQRRLMVPTSHKGRGTKQISRTAVPIGEDVINVLGPLIRMREGSAPLLLRPRWQQIGPANWQKTEPGPWRSASELTRPWKIIIDRAGLPKGTVPYALRHSSIVRGLRVGLPTRLVAALHDTSVSMIESHYSAFVVSALEDLTVRAIIPLTSKLLP